LAAVWFMALRFKIICQMQKMNLTLKDCVYLTMMALFFNNFFPSSVGGDVVKVYYAYKKTKTKLGSFAAVITDRFCGVVTFVIFALIALIFFHEEIANPYIFGAVIGVGLVALVVILYFSSKEVAKKVHFLNHLLPRRIDVMIEKTYRAFNRFASYRLEVVVAVLVSILAQLSVVTANYFVAKSLDLPIDFVVFILMIPLISFVSLLAPSLGGLGIREGAYIYFFSRFAPREGVLALSILWYGLLLGTSLLGGIWYSIQGKLHVDEIREAIHGQDMEDLLDSEA